MVNRVTLIVLDSVGIGELPDAHEYNDQGSNTLGNIAKEIKNFELPNLQRLGLGYIEGVNEYKKVDNVIGSYGRSLEMSKGKDTTTGHWEISGLILEKAFPTYPNGFPKELIEEFESKIGRKVIGNKPASGTAIIEELGDEHVRTGYPIVYTSADSVFQIAAHEEIIPLEELYKMCQIARDMLKDEHGVGRVIARPFVGTSGSYKRTPNRRDFSMKPFKKTLLNYIAENGMDVCAVGKIEDIFGGYGITKAVHTKNNMDGVDKTIEYLKENTRGLIFTNLVDFDMVYGHRNDVEGYARALKEFDDRIPEIINNLRDDDILIITADHGCDPTTPSTDHSREYIPIFVYGKNIKPGVNIGTRKSFADIGKTIAELLNIETDIAGESFAKEILK
ncbi:phosphopentomutase [Caloramator proteoclasticus]|uniref:Phosphopentomutase n=1 Tax=Caloramator proteoclasticus DSM 10124 TaxID=1121262 RepID=A0A1M4T9U4_9CLOT|nr:phosphopentomutase [Caloramator proteoclasticus]SHE41279.1 phosphopentomutase [Caloramator proteoclasticus DSM 10124]